MNTLQSEGTIRFGDKIPKDIKYHFGSRDDNLKIEELFFSTPHHGKDQPPYHASVIQTGLNEDNKEMGH